MNVLNISPRTDVGGSGIRLKRAFDRWTDWTYRSVVRRTNQFAYPTDLAWNDTPPAWAQADVVHVRQMFTPERLLRAEPKPYVIQHHGTFFREHWRDLLDEQRRRKAIGLVDTLDLWLMAPDDLTWLPAPYEVDDLRRMRRPSDVFSIAHAPTDRHVKSTAAFLSACERLGRELPVRLVLIEGATWAECLRRKAEADVYFDQVILGYGNNAIEAWAMGIPVVAGAAPDTLAEMERRFGGLPFVLADEGTIYEALRQLAEPAERQAWAERGDRHVRRFHDASVVVPQLQRVYEAAA